MNRDEVYRAGMSAYQEGRYQDAIDDLEKLSRSLDTTEGILSRFYLARAHYEVALAMFQERRCSDAAGHFRAASELSPEGISVGRYLAACYVGDRQYRLATIELERMLQQQPAARDVRIRLALIKWREGMGAEGLSILTEGLRIRPDDAELHYQLGVLYASGDEWEQAEACFARALQADDTHARACERLAQCCSVQGRHDEALGYLEQANQADPADARIAWQLSLLAPERGMHGRPVRLKRLSAAERSRLDQAAIEKLSEAVLADPDFVEAFLSLPQSEVDVELFSLLAQTLEYTLAAQPEYADLHYHCAAVYRRLGCTPKAIAHVERAVSLNPRYINALILLARLHGETQRCEEGISRLRQAIQAGADYPDVHFLMGQLAQRGGHADLARASFESALSLNRSYRQAGDALAALTN